MKERSEAGGVAFTPPAFLTNHISWPVPNPKKGARHSDRVSGSFVCRILSAYVEKVSFYKGVTFWQPYTAKYP